MRNTWDNIISASRSCFAGLYILELTVIFMVGSLYYISFAIIYQTQEY